MYDLSLTDHSQLLSEEVSVFIKCTIIPILLCIESIIEGGPGVLGYFI